MAGVSTGVALLGAYQQIVSAPGSPYYHVTAYIRCGGKITTPFKVVDLEIGQDYTSEFADSIFLTCEIGLGDAIYNIAPYAEDIRISIQKVPLNDQLGKTGQPAFRRTYTAYIVSEIPAPDSIGGNPLLRSVEVGNNHGFVQMVFKLEETAIVHFKRMTYGAVFNDTIPVNIALTFLEASRNKLKLSEDESLIGVDLTPADNTTPRNNIVIPDGTRLVDIPDYLQNKEGGIYNAGLGFYLTGKYVYLWSLYNTNRTQTANRLLRCYIAQDNRSSLVEHTWLENGRRLDIWCRATVSKVDERIAQRNIEGTGVIYTDTEKLMNGFAEVGDGKLVVKKGLNTNEFAYATPVNEVQNIKWGSRSTSNVFYEASVLAKRSGICYTLTWNHSNADLLTPNMAVEIVYAREGISKKIKATLLGTLTKISTVSDRHLNRGSVSETVLTVFISENDPMFNDWVNSGAVGRSTPPQID